MAAELFHSPSPEELMEYVDGEGSPEARAGIEAHLATCPSCQALAAGQRVLSRDVAAWTVAPAPDSLRAPHAAAPAVARPWWSRVWSRPLSRPARVVLVGLPAVAVLVMVSWSQSMVARRVAGGLAATDQPVLTVPELANRPETGDRRPGGGDGERGRPAFAAAVPQG